MKRLSLLAITVLTTSLPCLAQESEETLPSLDQTEATSSSEANPFGSGYVTEPLYSYSTGSTQHQASSSIGSTNPDAYSSNAVQPSDNGTSTISGTDGGTYKTDSLMPHGPR
jgi:hypothetical protein